MATELDNQRIGYSPQMLQNPLSPAIPLPYSTPVISYAASDSLTKKLKLPDRARWHVPTQEVYLEGELVIYTKSKSFFWDWYSDVATRPAIITRRGFLIVYMKNSKGYILNVSAANSIECTTDRKPNTRKLRTHIKIKYDFGNVHMWGLEQVGLDWKLAMQRAFEKAIPPRQTPFPSPKIFRLLPSSPEKTIEVVAAPPKPERQQEEVESEYAASELHLAPEIETMVSWTSINDEPIDLEQGHISNVDSKPESPKFRDASTNVPSLTHLARMRRFIRKGLPRAGRTVSAPHIQVIPEESDEYATIEPSCEATVSEMIKSAKDGNEQPKSQHKVAELRAKLEAKLPSKPARKEQHAVGKATGLYRWIKKTTGSPEKKAKVQIEESLTTIEYERALGWNRATLGSNSETNV